MIASTWKTQTAPTDVRRPLPKILLGQNALVTRINSGIGGAVTPSLTIMANALRFGDHLKERMR